MSEVVDMGPRPTGHVTVIDGHGLGRLAAPDVRDGRFRLAEIKKQLPKPEKVLTERNWGVDFKRLPVDQGATPRCVAFSAITALIIGPLTQRKALPDYDHAERVANEVYFEALKRDEWDGEDPEQGTSVRAGQKALVDRGLIGSFAWGESVEDAAEFILYHGPALAGTIWPDSIMRTDAKGYLNVDPDSAMDGQHAAGHAYCLAGVNTTTKNPDKSIGRLKIVQTWGAGWGWKDKGIAYMTFRTFGMLLMAGGEVCFPVENKIIVPPVAAAA